MCPLFGKILKETCTIYCFKILFQNCPLVVPVSSHRLSRDSLSLGHQGALFWSWPPDERIPKKALFFPLPFSILAGTNLISYYYFFCNPRLIPKKIHLHSIFGKIHPRLISEKIHPRLIFDKIHAKPPRKTKKKCFFFFLHVFSWSDLGVSLILGHWI